MYCNTYYKSPSVISEMSDTMRMYRISVHMRAYCAWPFVVSIHQVRSYMDCATLCMAQDNCYYFNLKNTAENTAEQPCHAETDGNTCNTHKKYYLCHVTSFDASIAIASVEDFWGWTSYLVRK